MEILVATLSNLLVQLPILLVWLIGIVLAFVFWRRHPQVSLLALIGFGLLFVLTVIGAFLNIALPVWMSQQRIPASQMSIVYLIRGVIPSLLNAVAWVLIR